jgi:aspartyl-tRNA(Asn)/glutamyl-tRNA(Gln) amidotransferase subunit A
VRRRSRRPEKQSVPSRGAPIWGLWSKGVRSTGGSLLLADFFPKEDATAIANLKKAGAILLGKNNVMEFAIGGGAERYSPPRNPWDLQKYAGGSSSGSAAATAAFLCATSLGEDTGGSIRFPASWCGLVGLRPSWGRVSRYGLMPGSWSMDTIGPISRSVEDAAITLGAIAGHDPKDPYTWNTPVPDYRRGLDAGVAGLRVGVVKERVEGGGIDPEVTQAVLKATSVLGELGASVEEVSLPLVRHDRLVMSVPLSVEPASIHRHWVRQRLHDYGHANRVRLLTGSILPAQVYYKAQKLRSMIAHQVREALETHDVLVLPTMGCTAVPLDGFDPVITSKAAASRMGYLLTGLFNLASAPAISVPCGISSQGLPIGLQIGGPPGGEETVLRVAYAYEHNTRWHTLRAPNA